MPTVEQFEIIESDYRFVIAVKKQVDELYEKQQIFNLSLETLELTRRFHYLFSKYLEENEIEQSAFNRFVALTRHLERNLVQEIQ